MNASITWTHLKLALQQFPDLAKQLAGRRSQETGCRLPVLDPWDPEILPWVGKRCIDSGYQCTPWSQVVETRWPGRGCNCWGVCTDNLRLLYAVMDRLYINTSAIAHLNMTREQVNC